MINDVSGSRSAYLWESATVASLGGPLLVCAADAFAAWGGAVYDADYELDPACDYARAWAAVHPDDDDLEAAFVRFGESGEHGGLVWEMDGEGTAEIACAGPAEGSGEDGFLIVRSWIRPGRTDAPRRRAAGASPEEEQEAGELELPGGRAVVVWAAADARETGSYPPPDADADADGDGDTDRAGVPVGTLSRLRLDGQEGIGAVLRVAPGTYRVTHGWHEGTRGRYLPADEAHGPARAYADDDWSCRWVRFTRIAPPPEVRRR
ncbi:hypothetical protein ACWDR0_00275 [Streptomyces sp. NPDC003691]